MLKPRALNYTPKAIADLRSHPCEGAPMSRMAMRWIADLLSQAQVFVLPNLGQLLDRSKPKPEVAGTIFRPPFPVTALEYSATDAGRGGDVYTAVSSSRRISLVWDWGAVDLPPALRAMSASDDLPPGVAIASVFYIDSERTWICTSGAAHLAYEGGWIERREDLEGGFVDAMIARGALNPAHAHRGYETSFIPLMAEQLLHAQRQLGSAAAAIDHARADITDEMNAYSDLCYALACKNVRPERYPAPKALNACRKGRKPLLKDFHILSLDDGEGGGQAFGGGDRTGPRSHLRRGHIRRLGPDRITWVNQTMVHGRGGFVDKAYAIGAVR